MPITPPEGFRHHIPIQVRWSDMDALGHVNNACFLTYCEQARIDYFVSLNLRNTGQPEPGLIIAKVVIDYLLPLYAGDDVHVFTRCSRLGGRSLETEQQVVRVKQQQIQVAAKATITVVVYDYDNHQSTAIPAAWRMNILEYEPGHIAQ